MKIRNRFNSTTPASELVDFHTPRDKVFVVYHMGVPALNRADWRLTIDGLVEKALTLSLDDLTAMPFVELTAFHECAGSPLRPKVPVRRVANVRWRGVRLKTVLDMAGIDGAARYVWARGADSGIYPPTGTHSDCYLKDLPLDKAIGDEVLLATEMNGEPLSEEHGAPVRMVVPGYYGTNSVKWLTGIRLEPARADAFFTTTLYVDRYEKDGIEHTRPVWDVAPNSLIVSPVAGQQLARQPLPICGWAWGGNEIVAVDISTDGGAHWSSARVDARSGPSWQRFAFDWHPERPGDYDVVSRATDSAGVCQPESDARHQVFRIRVSVVER
jgi:DMSO/TMAO reductase YedYZ molybdopterin-dependent catalytic subunit